jgi:thiamine biosynthesis protein ThiS
VEIIYNGQKREIAEGATVADLLAQLDRPAQQVAVEVNLVLAPRERHAEWRLQPGDQVDVFTLAGGG